MLCDYFPSACRAEADDSACPSGQGSDFTVFTKLILSLPDDQHITGYIGALMHKTIVIAVDPLLALGDMVATCSGQLATHILSLVIYAI
jgi:hypothetical protein